MMRIHYDFQLMALVCATVLCTLFGADAIAQAPAPFLVSSASSSTTQTANGTASISGVYASGPVSLASDDGRFVLYGSAATNIVSGQSDQNANVDRFLLDRLTGVTILVSHVPGSTTQAGNGPSYSGAMSGDGAWIAFQSAATDLVSGIGDNNAVQDIFLFERSTGQLTLVSRSKVASNSTGNGACAGVRISRDGRYVAFLSTASDLVAGQTDSNGANDLFVYDRVTQTTRLCSHIPASTTTAGNGGVARFTISDDGLSLAYQSSATDIAAGATDTNAQIDIFLYSYGADSTTLISHAAGTPLVACTSGTYPCVISGDGNYVLYHSISQDLIAGQIDNWATDDVFLWERSSNTSRLVSHIATNPSSSCLGLSGPGLPPQTYLGTLSYNGRYVAYIHNGTNLVTGQQGGGDQVFLYDRVTDMNVMISHAAGTTATGTGTTPVPPHREPWISSDGSFVAFSTNATNLVSGTADTNATNDLYLYVRSTGALVLASRTSGSATTCANNVSSTPIWCRNVSLLVLVTSATDMGGTDTNAAADIYGLALGALLSGVNPGSGLTSGGNTVTISGRGLMGVTSVKFDGIAATNLSIVSDQSLTCTAPAHTATGPVNVEVATAWMISTLVNGYTYSAPASPPTLTSVSPATGATAGGTAVTLTGANFTGASSVTFGGVAASNLVVASATSITCTTPAHSAGAVSVIVTTPSGSNASNSLFTYLTPAPTLTSVSPSTGSTLGGTSVTLTGTDFTGATSVTFGGTAASSVNVVNATTITCATPAHAAGVVSVIVTTPAGSNAANTLFSYVTPAPTLSQVSPSSGTTLGGTNVTLTGTNFTGATSVTFGGSAATSLSVVNATTITCTTPAHAAGAVSVLVTTPGGTNAANTLFTYVVPAPTVTAVSPNNGPTAGGTSVTLTGTHFTGATAVSFGGSAATGISVVSATSITCTTPAHAAANVSVEVTTPGGTSAANTLFTFVAPTPAPTVTGVSPPTGLTSGGTSVTITGLNFSGATLVTFGGSAASGVSVISANTITCTTPAHAAGAVSVEVTTPAGVSPANALFTYTLPAPTVSGVTPATGTTAGGTSVSIAGANFTGATSVSFDGFAATSVNVVSATLITCTTPAHSAGAVSVIVTTPSGNNAANTAFSYVSPAPTLASVTPSSGTTAGGTSVTLIGTDFTGATSVTFGGAAASSVSVLNATTLTCVTPAHAAGAVSVLVSTPSGANAANTLFTFQTPAAPQEMDVQRTGTPVADGGIDSVQGSAGVSFTLTYSIQNSGGTALAITGSALVSNLVNCTATVTQQPTASVVAGGSTSLTLSVTPTSAGAFAFDMSIASNDSDESPYNWSVSGQAASGTNGGNGTSGAGGGGCTAEEGSAALMALLLLIIAGATKVLRRRA